MPPPKDCALLSRITTLASERAPPPPPSKCRPPPSRSAALPSTAESASASEELPDTKIPPPLGGARAGAVLLATVALETSAVLPLPTCKQKRQIANKPSVTI